MKNSTVLKIVGFLIAGASMMMFPPALVSWWYQDGTASIFLISAVILFIIGMAIFLPVRNSHQELRLRDGFLIVAASWLTLALVGALPFLLLTQPDISYVDAVFESMSGLTTTGSTILTNIDGLPRGILYYRQQLQWLGGLGIVVLAVAILPMLRVGGMQLYRAETPGPMKDSKLTPRITETAKALWLIYLGITVLAALAYWLGGMTLFDAVGHAFSTVSTGGMSTHDAGFGWFDNPTLETIATVFMVVSGINFATHFTSWKRASAQPYFQDPELKVYASLLLGFAVLVSIALYLNGTYGSIAESARYAGFQVVSIMTSTGYTTTDFSLWPGFIPILLILVAFIGGCAGSTSGGMKVIRIMLLYRQAIREIHRLIHPHAVIPVKIGGRKTSTTVMDAVWGFFFLYVTSFVLITIALNGVGVDPVTAYSAAAASLTNLGPGLGDVSANYASLNSTAKVILSFAMLLGRLEIFTILVLFTPAFWRD
ncbi:MAG: TrkH family potassium uptake protein [Gammaproteobacteria bacterium]|nr:MAG: TrkH family potassium uptake protein [Gammaproteobacteria bacterium]